MTTFVKDYERPAPFGAGWKQLWQNRLEHACFLLSISDGIERVLPRVLQLCKSANDLVEYYETAPPGCTCQRRAGLPGRIRHRARRLPVGLSG